MSGGGVQEVPRSGPSIPQRPLDAHEVAEQIGMGLHADVYRAVSKASDGTFTFALKRIRSDLSSDRRILDALDVVAKVAMQCDAENVLTVYDAGLYEGRWCVACEFVEGTDLGDLQRRIRQDGLTMPIPQAAFLAMEVARALEACHALELPDGRPFAHGALRKANVLVSFDGDVRVSDFGVRRALDAAAQPHAGQSVDADIAAIGELLFEMLAGRRYVKGRGGDILRYRDDLPEAVAMLVNKVLGGGYETAKQVREDLSETMEHLGFQTSREGVARYVKALVGSSAFEDHGGDNALPTPNATDQTPPLEKSLAAAWRWTHADREGPTWTAAGLLWTLGLAMGVALTLLFGAEAGDGQGQDLARVRVIAPPDTQVTLDGDVVGREWTLDDDHPHVFGISSDTLGEWETLLRVHPGEKRVYVFPSNAAGSMDDPGAGR